MLAVHVAGGLEDMVVVNVEHCVVGAVLEASAYVKQAHLVPTGMGVSCIDSAHSTKPMFEGSSLSLAGRLLGTTVLTSLSKRATLLVDHVA